MEAIVFFGIETVVRRPCPNNGLTASNLDRLLALTRISESKGAVSSAAPLCQTSKRNQVKAEVEDTQYLTIYSSIGGYQILVGRKLL
jgi:hypothetical protein